MRARRRSSAGAHDQLEKPFRLCDRARKMAGRLSSGVLAMIRLAKLLPLPVLCAPASAAERLSSYPVDPSQASIAPMYTLQSQLNLVRNRPTGFDYLRLTLALSIIVWHSVTICYGPL